MAILFLDYLGEGTMINLFRNNFRSFLLLASCLLLLTSFLSPAPALAHKVQMFAYAEGERVFVEGYFPDGKKTIHSEVVVYDNFSGEELLKGTTDDAGKFSFKVPRKTDLRITLNASLGHKTEHILPGSELSSGEGMESQNDNTTTESGERDRVNVDQTDIQVMIEKGVERGISPLLRGFSECKERIFFSEIIGGIGYIFGILGIMLYFKTRKDRK